MDEWITPVHKELMYGYDRYSLHDILSKMLFNNPIVITTYRSVSL